MKNQIIMTVLMTVLSLGVLAQEKSEVNAANESLASSSNEKMTNKKGYVILPEAGDWNVLLDATPFLNFAGNIFTSGPNSAPTFSAPDGVLVRGRYFVKDNFAYRLGVNLGRFTNATRGEVQDDIAVAADPNSEEIVYDYRRQGNTQVVLSAGMEWRRGNKRIQGYWGFDGLLGFNQTFDRYNFGNEINNAFDANTWTRSTIFANPNLIAQRQMNIQVGASGIAGLEYFIAPKLSLGGEFALNLFWVFQGRNLTITEDYDNNLNEIVTETNRGAIRAGQGGLVTNPNGNIVVSFYF